MLQPLISALTGRVDQVELANMNRLFFRPEHCGLTKTEAAARTLEQINPDVELEPYTMNITTMKGFEAFQASLVQPGTSRSRVDLVLACVDNYEARITINQVHTCWHVIMQAASLLIHGLSGSAISKQHELSTLP